MLDRRAHAVAIPTPVERRYRMSKITTEMQALVSRERLGFLATVCDDGSPNLSPKGLTFVLDDEHLVIGDVRCL